MCPYENLHHRFNVTLRESAPQTQCGTTRICIDGNTYLCSAYLCDDCADALRSCGSTCGSATASTSRRAGTSTATTFGSVDTTGDCTDATSVDVLALLLEVCWSWTSKWNNWNRRQSSSRGSRTLSWTTACRCSKTAAHGRTLL